jgi:3-deoxy-D-manno-octulosonic-acid transferase
MVPRHFERGKEVGRELSARGIKFVYRNTINAQSQYQAGEVECLLVNTTGELKYFYEHATLIFVGKSLVTPGGGQNPIEPGSLGKAMVFGPNMQNFSAIAAALVEKKGAVQIGNPAELEEAFGRLLEDENQREELGRNALRVVQQNQGAMERTVEMIVRHLPHEEMVIVSNASEE